ncbi:MAG: leucine-rich repeat protein [Oscillospiraceae bacterium]|nr:leucine-rich repeat protein [Oscillospiraceae bacterium]
MQCEKCHAELPPSSISCPACGAPVLQNIEGFENTKFIQQQLKTMIKEHKNSLFIEYEHNLMFDEKRFTALLNDYISEYDRECKLLRAMVNNNQIIKVLLSEQQNHEMAVTRAKSVMLGEAFLSENAAEFVIACLTFMLGWPYQSPLRIKEASEIEKEEKAAKVRAVRLDDNVFTRASASKYRLLARNVTVPEGTTMIEDFCFDGFNNLRSIALPESLLAIGEYAFSECKHLRVIDLSDNVRRIGKAAFIQCERLASIRIPNGIHEIADSTFLYCKSLEIVDIPDTVSNIGEQAFAGCEKLRKLTLPPSIKFIDKNAFAYCPRLTIRCVENSYVYKYCLVNAIPWETYTLGRI